MTGLKSSTYYEFRVYGDRSASSTCEAASSIVSTTAYTTTGVALAHPLNNLNIKGETYDGHQPTALDFAPPPGAVNPGVYATMTGTIEKVVRDYPNDYYSGKTGQMNEYGNYIDIKVSDGSTLRYAHLRNDVVEGIEEGATVYAGQLIAYVGSNGYTDHIHWVHLHFKLMGTGDVEDYYLHN